MLEIIKEFLCMDAMEIIRKFDKLATKKGIEKISYARNKWAVYTKNEYELKPLITAHFDTINGNIGIEPKHLKIDKDILSLEKNSPYYCLGADDRAGLAIIYKLMEKCPNDYHFVLFGQEETGGVGSSTFVDVEYLLDLNLDVSLNIGIDRRGTYHFVDYGYKNSEISNFLNMFGFDKERGSFSDISTLAEVNGMACVNFATGYNLEHTKNETMDCNYAKELLQFLSSKEFLNFVSNVEFETEMDFETSENRFWEDSLYWENEKFLK